MSDEFDAISDNGSDLTVDFDTMGYTDERELDSNLADGKYLAVLDAVEKDLGGKSPCLKLTFGVKKKNGTTTKLIERLFLTEKSKQRLLLFANRLGLIGNDDLGKPSVRRSWNDALGKEVVIEVGTREFVKNDGTKGKASSLTFNGIWKTTDPAVADVLAAYGPGGTPKTPAAPAAAGQFNDM